MDDICLLKLAEPGDIGTRCCHVYLPEALTGEMEMPEHAPALPQEVPLQPERTGQTDHGNVFCLLVAYQHLCLNAIVVKGIHQAVGCYCRSACLFTCIYYEYSHLRIFLIPQKLRILIDTAKIVQIGDKTK